MAAVPTTRLQHLVTELGNIGPNSDAQIKFILETHPFDGQTPASPSGDRIITGRLLPNSDIYKQGSIKIRIELGTAFPFKPPLIRSETKLYHPNVNENGYFSIDLLNPTTSWKSATTLVKIVEEITKIIDTPSVDIFQNDGAAKLYSANYAEYKRIATETFNRYCSPRN